MFQAFSVFFISVFLFSCILLVISSLISFKINSNTDKFDLYECGFKAFTNSRQAIDLQFFLICILFVIFDLELVYFLPWFSNLFIFGLNSLYILVFMILLILGYVFEYNEGLFNWSLYPTPVLQKKTDDAA